MTRKELERHAYVQQLEEHLHLTVSGGGAAGPEAAVLLVRGALTADDRPRAAELAAAAERMTKTTPGDRDLEAAGAHARGLLEQDPAVLEWAARRYSTPLGRAWATEDAGVARAQHGDRAASVTRLNEALALYQQLDAVGSTARVRALLRAAGNVVRHWRQPARDKPAFGWASLTQTERRVAHLAAEGLSNRQIASQMFLSVHTVAFHMRHIFCKLDLTSRVQLASLVAQQVSRDRDGQARSSLQGAQ